MRAPHPPPLLAAGHGQQLLPVDHRHHLSAGSAKQAHWSNLGSARLLSAPRTTMHACLCRLSRHGLVGCVAAAAALIRADMLWRKHGCKRETRGAKAAAATVKSACGRVLQHGPTLLCNSSKWGYFQVSLASAWLCLPHVVRWFCVAGVLAGVHLPLLRFCSTVVSLWVCIVPRQGRVQGGNLYPWALLCVLSPDKGVCRVRTCTLGHFASLPCDNHCAYFHSFCLLHFCD